MYPHCALLQKTIMICSPQPLPVPSTYLLPPSTGSALDLSHNVTRTQVRYAQTPIYTPERCPHRFNLPRSVSASRFFERHPSPFANENRGNGSPFDKNTKIHLPLSNPRFLLYLIRLIHLLISLHTLQLPSNGTFHTTDHFR